MPREPSPSIVMVSLAVISTKPAFPLLNVLALKELPPVRVTESAVTLIFPLLPVAFLLTRFRMLLSSLKLTAPVASIVISPA